MGRTRSKETEAVGKEDRQPRYYYESVRIREKAGIVKDVDSKDVTCSALRRDADVQYDYFINHYDEGKTLGNEDTPWKIVEDMIDLLPDSVWNPHTKFLDIYCKSGIFLEVIKNTLIDKCYEQYKELGLNTDKEINKYIFENQIYGLCWSDRNYGYTAESLFMVKCPMNSYNIKKLSEIIGSAEDSELVKNEKIGNTDKYIGIKEVADKLFKEYRGEMKIDVVVGNPPYNNDLYIPFVEMGHKISNDYSIFITPAKWQAKGDNASDKPNERFRKSIVPCMNKIVYYKDSKDAFDIEEWGGVCYYVLNKDTCVTHELKCICNSNKSLNNNYETHDEKDIILYGRDLLTIIGKVGQLGDGFKQSLYVKNTDRGEQSIDSQLGDGFKQSLYVKNTDRGEQSIDSQLGFKRQVFVGEQDRGQQEIPSDYVEVMQGAKVCGYKKKSELFTQLKIDKWKCICSIMPGAVSQFDKTGKVLGMFKISIIKPNQVPKGSFPVLKYFDTENECKSFVSYMECRLTAFLYYLGCCGTTLTKEFFRFIPDTMKYDHIFTDAELYAKYNLTDEEIAVIESVIKERK